MTATPEIEPLHELSTNGHQISQIELHMVPLPKFKPFRIAYGVIPDPHLFVRIKTNNGFEGWGDSGHFIPGYSGEMWETALVHGSLLGELALGSSPYEIGRLHAKWDAALASGSQVKCAFDIALYDVAARIAGLSISEMLGGPIARTFPVEMNVMIGTIEEVVEDAGRALSLGIRTLGIKAGRPTSPSIEHDVAMFRAIREAHGTDFDLWVDFNAGSSRHEAVHAIKALEPYGVGQVEQPVPAWDLDGMAYIADRVNTPLVADEPVTDAQSVLRIAEKRAADVIHSKMPKAGGIHGAMKIAATCEALNLPLTTAGLGLSTYSQAALMHFLSTQPICHLFPHKLRAGTLVYESDIVDAPPPLVDGAFALPEGAGTGLELDVEKVVALATESQVLAGGDS